MKKIYLYTIVFALISHQLTAQLYNLSTDKSSLSWTGKAAFNAYSLIGTLKAKYGTISIENDTVKALDVVINMKSLHHKNKDLKKHLKNKDFFEVKKYEKASFKLLEPVKIINNKAILVGLMTIKNISKKEEIEVEILQKDGCIIQFTKPLNRIKYGVTFNSPSLFKKMKENAIADEFVLESKLIFN